MTDQPSVSILIPTLNEERHLRDVLEACVAQTYPRELIEVVVVDGGSTDGTRAEFDGFADRLGSLTWLDNAAGHQAAGLNLAVERSTGEVLVRWDAHAAYSNDYVESAVRLLAEPGVDVVGGQWTPAGSTPFQDAVAAAMASRIGVGNDRYTPVRRRRVVDTVSCGVMLRRTFEGVGGFDTNLQLAGEDADLMYRIRSRGGVIVLDPTLEVQYFPRGTPGRLAKQYYGYGLAKAAMLVKHRAFPSLRPLAPAGLVGALAVGLATGKLRGLVPWIVTAYGAALLIGSFATVRGSARRRFGAACVVPLMHIPYGVGVWVGLGSAAIGLLRSDAVPTTTDDRETGS